MADRDDVSSVTTDRRDAVVIAGARGLAIVSGALATALTIGVAGADLAGRFFGLTSVVHIVAVLGRAGLDRSVIAEVAAAGSAHGSATVLRRHRRASIAASTAAGLALAAAVGVANRLTVGTDLLDVTPVGAVMVGLWAGVEAHRWWVSEANRAAGRLVAASLAGEGVRSAVLLVALLILGLGDRRPSLTALVAIGALASAVPLLPGRRSLRPLTVSAPRPDGGAVWAALGSSRRYLGGELAAVLSTWAPVAIAAVVVPGARAAGFTLGLRFAALIGAPLLAMANYFLPKVAAALAAGPGSGGPEQAEAAMVPATRRLFVVSLAGAPLLVAVAYLLAPGETSARIAVAAVTAVLSIGQLASVGYGLCAMTLLAGGRPMTVAANTALGAAITCVAGTAAAVVGGDVGLAAVVAAVTVMVNHRNSSACASLLGVRTGVLGGLRP